MNQDKQADCQAPSLLEELLLGDLRLVLLLCRVFPTASSKNSMSLETLSRLLIMKNARVMNGLSRYQLWDTGPEVHICT